MGQSIVQHTQTQSTTTVSSLSKAFASNNAVNNLLVYATTYDSASPTPTLSDSRNTTQLDVGPTTNATLGAKNQVNSVPNCGAGANTVQAAWGAPNPTFAGLYIHEYTDSASHSNGFTKDQTAATTGNSANPASGNTPATTQANEIVFGFSASNGPVPTAGSGFTIEESDSVLNGIATEDKFVTSTGVQNATFTEVSSQWIAQCVTYFTAAVGGGGDSVRGPNVFGRSFPKLQRRKPQIFPDFTAFPPAEIFNYSQNIPKKGRGPGRVGPAGRMAPQRYPDNPAISSNVGAYSWKGNKSPLSIMINASVGSYTWQGKGSPLSTMINASVGSYTWQGRASPLSKMINASVGFYTWQGKTSPLSKMINASGGAWSWSGIHADLGGAVNITATLGAYSWSGVPAQIQQIITINAQIGVYSWGGVQAQVITTLIPSKGLAQYGVSFRRKRSQMDEPPDLDVRSALQEVLIKRGLIEKVEYSVSTQSVSETEELVEVKASGISQRDLQAIIIALLASEL